jgi:SAM-dependent methyltransferase
MCDSVLVGGDYDIDWSEHSDHLAAAARTDAEWYSTVAADLVRPADRLLVDVGCGGAGMATALALAAPAARVVAVDGDEDVLAAAAENLASAGVRHRVRLTEADLTLPVADLAAVLGADADLIWASAVVHHAGDQQGAVDALAGLLAPGGRLALAEGGLAARHLPWDVGVGDPGLELRLDAAQDRWFAAMRSELPGSVRMPYGWPVALRRAGLTDVTTRTGLIERPPSLTPGDLARITDRLRHWVDRLREHNLLSVADLDAWSRLLDPDSADWLGSRDDVYDLTARTVHVGTRPPPPTSR